MSMIRDIDRVFDKNITVGDWILRMISTNSNFGSHHTFYSVDVIKSVHRRIFQDLK